MSDERQNIGGCFVRVGEGPTRGHGEPLNPQLAERDAELLRVRTAQHGAAHELDNIAVECGLGHSPKPGDVAAHVRTLTAQLAEARERAAKAEAQQQNQRDSLENYSNAIRRAGFDPCDFSKAVDKMAERIDRLRDAIGGWEQYADADPQVKGECLREARERTRLTLTPPPTTAPATDGAGDAKEMKP